MKKQIKLFMLAAMLAVGSCNSISVLDVVCPSIPLIICYFADLAKQARQAEYRELPNKFKAMSREDHHKAFIGGLLDANPIIVDGKEYPDYYSATRDCRKNPGFFFDLKLGEKDKNGQLHIRNFTPDEQTLFLYSAKCDLLS